MENSYEEARQNANRRSPGGRHSIFFLEWHDEMVSDFESILGDLTCVCGWVGERLDPPASEFFTKKKILL